MADDREMPAGGVYEYTEYDHHYLRIARDDNHRTML